MHLIRVLFLIALSAHVLPVCGQEVARGHVDGSEVRAVLTLEQILNSTAWDPNDSNQPPVEIKDALRLAKGSLAKEYPRYKDIRWSISITVRPLNYFDPPNGEPTVVFSERWVYLIRFREIPAVANSLAHAMAPDIPVVVLMNGTVAVGTEIATVDRNEKRPEPCVRSETSKSPSGDG